ncbi:hypothetical protein BH09PLA1_BH09PLA1_26590 [soil metagenome]
MEDTNQPREAGVEPADAAPETRRSKLRLTLNLLTQLFLIAILAVIIFVMWLPAIVSKK